MEEEIRLTKILNVDKNGWYLIVGKDGKKTWANPKMHNAYVLL